MKKLIAFVLAVCLLSGCSLATGEMDPEVPSDHTLTGMLVSISVGEENTDIWDADAAGMEPIHLIPMEGERLFAECLEGEDGTKEYRFPEGLGYSYFCYLVHSDDGNEAYSTITVDPELMDSGPHIHSDGNGNTSYIVETTIYATPDSIASVYMNPVYQTSEGEVYALATAPMGVELRTMDGYSETLEQNVGEKSSTVKLNVAVLELPEEYVIIEMDGDNQPLKQTAYAPAEMPESYAPGADTAYIILEWVDGENTTRTVYSPGDASKVMDTFYPGEYGICIKCYTRIEWEGA